MTMLVYDRKMTGEKEDFLFVIDDLNDYKALSDFKSRKACELFQEWQARTQQHQRDIEQLDSYRMEYSESASSAKARLKDPILQLEGRVENEALALKSLEYEIRRLEQESLYGTNDISEN